MNFDFGELKNDTNFVSKVKVSSETIAKIRETVQKALEIDVEKLSENEKLQLNIFLAYAANSIYFMYLRVNGDDKLSSHPVRQELVRIKEAMERNKQILERNLRPKVDEPAAKRFIRAGLYDHKKKNEEYRRKQQPLKIQIHQDSKSNSRKRKFTE